MALRSKYADQSSGISQSLSKLMDSAFRAGDAGVDNIVMEVIYRSLDKLAISVEDFEEHTFEFNEHDIECVRELGSDYFELDQYIRSKYRTYVNNTSSQAQSFIDMINSLSELKFNCQKKIEERFSYYKLGRSYSLNKKEIVHSLYAEIIERLDIVATDSAKKLEMWNALANKVDSYLGIKARHRAERLALDVAEQGSGEDADSFLKRIYGDSIEDVNRDGLPTHELSVRSSSFKPGPATKANVTSDTASQPVGDVTKLQPSNTDDQSGQKNEDNKAPSEPSKKAIPKAPPGGEFFATHAGQDKDVVEFIERVYGRAGYLTGAFTRAHLRKIDPDAVIALETWEQGTRTRPKGRAPLKLPTRTERNNELRNADPDTLTDAEKLARNRLLAIQKYQAKRLSPDI